MAKPPIEGNAFSPSVAHFTAAENDYEPHTANVLKGAAGAMGSAAVQGVQRA
jgi:hypothetical protein